MTLALDFGSTSIKAVLIDDNGKSRFFTLSIGLKTPIFSRSSLFLTLKILEEVSGLTLVKGEKVLSKIYVCVGLPVYEPVDLLSGPVILTGQALSSFSLNILDVGSEFVHFNDRVSIAEISPDEVMDWLPFKADITDVANFIGNKKLYGAVPGAPRDLFLEQAIARVRISKMFHSQRLGREFSEIYLTGAVFSKAPYLEQAVLTLLDGLQPGGQLSIYLDRNQILPAAGLLKSVCVKDFTLLGDEFNSLFLGTALTTVGDCEVEIDMGLKEPQKINLSAGDLYSFPLKTGEEAKITVKRKGVNSGQVYEVAGGSVGLVFDGRGRPLKLPESSFLRHDLLKAWDRSIGGSGQMERI